MKTTIALLPVLLLLSACASSSADDVTGGRALDCRSGQALEVRAGIDQSSFEARGSTGRFNFIIEVANNSHQDVTVKTLAVTSRRSDQSAFENAFLEANQDIPEGTEHVFEIPTTTFVRFLPERDARTNRENFEFGVTVNLTNGDSYRCYFQSTFVR